MPFIVHPLQELHSKTCNTQVSIVVRQCGSVCHGLKCHHFHRRC